MQLRLVRAHEMSLLRALIPPGVIPAILSDGCITVFLRVVIEKNIERLPCNTSILDFTMSVLYPSFSFYFRAPAYICDGAFAQSADTQYDANQFCVRCFADVHSDPGSCWYHNSSGHRYWRHGCYHRLHGADVAGKFSSWDHSYIRQLQHPNAVD